MNFIKKPIIAGAIATALALIATPALATSNSTVATVEPTFIAESNESQNQFQLQFGKNFLLAGNDTIDQTTTDGLLFSFGNTMEEKSKSEYLFVAGNIVNIASEAHKDAFIAGNVISIEKEAKIHGDIFATGNSFKILADLEGDVSIAANQVTFRGTHIAGNVNLTAVTIIFENEITIDGTLVYNDDAEVSGLSKVHATRIETFTPQTYTIDPGVIWLGKLVSICSLIIVMILVLLVFPKSKTCIEAECHPTHAGKNLLVGLGALILIPIVAVLLLMTYVGAIAGLVVLAVYIIMIYLAQAFAGTYFGHLLMSKLFHLNAPLALEAIVGIVMIALLEMVPAFGTFVSVVATVVGFGVLVAVIRPGKKAQVGVLEIEETSTTLENPFRTTGKSATNKKATSKKTSAGQKSTKSTRTTVKKSSKSSKSTNK